MYKINIEVLCVSQKKIAIVEGISGIKEELF
jgi:hypothetical protein